jgi:hypothetical protein
MDKIKNQLAGVAALLGVIAAIGGGFVKYGEIVTKLEALEGASGGTDWSAQIAVLEEKVSALENVDTTHIHKLVEHDHPVEHSHTKTVFRCLNCGSDLEQHVNGKISYLPHVTKPKEGEPFVKEWRDEKI